MIDDKQLITQLLASDLIDSQCLKQGLELAEEEQAPLYNVLLSHQLLDEQDVVATASDILNVPSIHLQEEELDQKVANLIPIDLALSSQTLPLEVIEDDGVEVLKLAMTDPIDVMAMDEIASHIGIDIRPVLAGPSDLKGAIDELYGNSDSDSDEVIELDEIDFEDDEVIELADMELEDHDLGLEVLDDDDAGVMPELIDAPTNMVADEDSWAAMFDSAQQSESEDSGEGVVQDKNAQSFFSGALADDDDGADDAEDDSPAEVGEAQTVTYEQGQFDSNQTMLGAPVAMEELGLDSQDDEEDEEDDENSDVQEFDNSHTQVGNPAKMGLDEAFGKSGRALFSAEESNEDPSAEDSSDDADFESLELSEEFYELDEDDAEADKQKVDNKEEITDEEATQQHRAPSTSRYTPAGIGARGINDEESEGDEAADATNETKKKKKGKSAVPKSIRAALRKASQRNEDKKKELKETKEKIAAPTGLNKKQPTKDKTDDSSDGSPLGRIEVKKVAVPTFKGAIEKRSDRERKENQRKKTPTNTDSPANPKTREISLSEMANLSRELNDQQSDPSSVELLQFPSEIDTDTLLRGLIQLLLAKDLISREDIDVLIDELT